MATTITEIEQIDAIECLESGAIQVKKGTYYEKTVTETLPVMETVEVSRTPVLDEDGNAVMETKAVVDSDGNMVLDDDGMPVTEEVARETVVTEEQDTGETREQDTVTMNHVGNWRGVIGLRDTARATELLGDKDKIAFAHWATFAEPAPEPEPEVESLSKPTEDNTIAEIKAYLDQESIEYTSTQTKTELLSLIPE
tara:strand:+ start:597 stop:1187 length:591 start_codon:yes stop_codon:yes gene_type:complete